MMASTKYNWNKDAPSSFARWADIGDTVKGAVAVISEDGTTYSGDPCPQLIIDTAFGEQRIVNVAQANLRRKVGSADPQVGDLIEITYTGNKDLAGGKTMKEFAVVVTAGEGEAFVKAGEKEFSF